MLMTNSIPGTAFLDCDVIIVAVTNICQIFHFLDRHVTEVDSLPLF